MRLLLLCAALCVPHLAAGVEVISSAAIESATSTRRYSAAPSSSSDDVQGFPFVSAMDQEQSAVFDTEDAEWLQNVCSSATTCPAFAQTLNRRLATVPSVDSVQSLIGAFKTDSYYQTTFDFVTNIGNGPLLAFGMIASPIFSSMTTSFGEAWGKLQSKLLAQANMVNSYVDQTEKNNDFKIARNKMKQFITGSSVFNISYFTLKQDLGTICTDVNTNPTLTLEQLNSFATEYVSKAAAMCTTLGKCVDQYGLEYVLYMTAAYSNAMICAAQVTKNSDNLYNQALAYSKQIDDVGTAVAKAVEAAKTFAINATNGGGSGQASHTIAEMFDQIKTKDNMKEKDEVIDTYKGYFPWAAFKILEFSGDDADEGKDACGFGVTLEGQVGDVNCGMMYDQAKHKGGTVLVWQPDDSSSADCKYTITSTDFAKGSSDTVNSIIDSYHKQPADQHLGLAVYPRIHPRNGWTDCYDVTTITVTGKKYVTPDIKTVTPNLNQSARSDVDALIKSQTESSSGSTLSTTAAVDYFNKFQGQQDTLQKVLEDFGTSELAKAIGKRDPAVLTGGEFGLSVLGKATENELAKMDQIQNRVDDTHKVEMSALTGVSNKLDTTHAAEMQGLDDLGTTVTGQHNEEMKEYGVISADVDTLGSTIDTGFSQSFSAVQSVQSTISNDLAGISHTVGSSAEETRQKVKSVLDQTTQKTLQALGSLSQTIDSVNTGTINALGQLQSSIEQRSDQLRQSIQQEFYQRQVQVQNSVVETTNLVLAAADSVTNTLLSEIDVVQAGLGKQLVTIASSVDVMDGHLVALEAQLTDARKQVDKMLVFLANIQQKTTNILKSVQNIPELLRKALFEHNVDHLTEAYKKLNYAFTQYIATGMLPLYRYELLTACKNYAQGDTLFSAFIHLAGVTSRSKLIDYFGNFDYDRSSYERFGGEMIVGAYGLQRLSLTCSRLKLNLTTESFVALSRTWDVDVNTAMGVLQVNIEEAIPQFFLDDYYTFQQLSQYLQEARALVSSNDGDFAFEAIEQVRYRIQEDLGTYASVSVINVDDASKLSMWVSSGGAGNGINRYGFLNSPSSLLVLWSNTAKQIPSVLNDKLRIELPTTISTSSLATAFHGTMWQAYWDHGMVRTVVRVEKIGSVCPWAIADAAYPYCWAGSGSACYCVQLEGISDSPSTQELSSANQVPTYYTLYTVFDDSSAARSDFLTSASIDAANASDVSLGANKMRGVPSNRLSYSICMSSAKPHQVCDISDSSSTWCHQPPPQFKRCISNTSSVFDIVNSNSSGADAFIKTGLSVTDTMFRTMEVGATVSEITFFDAQHGAGNYVVCTDCSMADFKTVYMFRIMSFKVGRPQLETTVVCTRHPRLSNVEFCPMSPDTPALWTPQVLLNTEMTQRVKQVGSQLESGLTDPQAIASKINDGLQELMGTSFAFFKVYIAQEGSFNATLNPNGYWTSLPNETATQERGWSPVPAVYSTTINDTATVFDALVMWSTLAVEERNLAELVVKKKPNGSSLKAYLASAFSEYSSERILRGHFAEKFIGLDCPVAGDTDHFAYCTPEPVDGLCMCVQLEDLPEEYTELYSGKAPNGKVVSYAMTDAIASPYVVGRSKGAFSLNGKTAAQTINGFPARNVSEISLCLSNVNHPELGATCISETNTDFALRSNATTTGSTKVEYMGDSNVVVGAKVASVQVQSESWVALCKGCTSEFVAQIVRFSKGATTVTLGGLTAGSMCQHSAAEGGGDLYMCLN